MAGAVTLLYFCLIDLDNVIGDEIVRRSTSTGQPGGLAFERNRGQSDPQVDFLARVRGYTVFLTRREAVLSLRSSKR